MMFLRCRPCTKPKVETMNQEPIGIILVLVAIFGTGITLALLLVPGQRELQRQVSDLRERMARLEGLFEGFIRRAGTQGTPD